MSAAAYDELAEVHPLVKAELERYRASLSDPFFAWKRSLLRWDDQTGKWVEDPLRFAKAYVLYWQTHDDMPPKSICKKAKRNTFRNAQSHHLESWKRKSSRLKKKINPLLVSWPLKKMNRAS